MNQVLLVNLNWRRLDKIGRLSKYNPHPALELLYASASLDKAKIINKFIDLWAENKEIDDYKEDIKKADITVIDTAPSYTFWRDGTLDADFSKQEIQKIRNLNKDMKIIVIGPHGTVKPETFFDSEADFILRGEPDLEITELVKQIKKKKVNLDSVCYKKNNKWIVGNSRACVDDLTKLPIIPYEKINFKNYSWPKCPIQGLKRTIVYETSRGCPFNCIFCFRAGFRGVFRKKSIKQISKELDKLKRKIDYIYLIDETFAVDKNWSKLVCKEFKKRNLKWGCETRPECLNKEMIDMMNNSGCVIVHLGLESANKEVLNALGKGTVDLKKLKADISYMANKGMHIKLYCTAGSPKETKDSLKETLNYVLQFDLSKVNASINAMIPYPETALWNLGKKEGRKLDDWTDISSNIGVIGNKFKNTNQVMKEVAKFNAYILKKKSVLFMKEGVRKGNIIKILKFSIIYMGCLVLIAFPGLFNLFYKFYRFI